MGLKSEHMAKQKKIAIIGSGIAGLTTAFELHKEYEVTLFEKENYFGGHTDTHKLLIGESEINVDSGFIIFCPEYYPNFYSMLLHLGVDIQKTDMSFSAFNKNTGLVYNATSLNKLFCQRRNLLRPSFYRMLFDIVRFYRAAKKILKSKDQLTTVGAYLKTHRYSKGFTEDHLLPMISALWSATPEHVLQFPIRHLCEFFANHGLLKIVNRPQWYVVKNGSSAYVDALRNQLSINWHLSSEVVGVRRGDTVEVLTKDQKSHYFDAVVLATHANQALDILSDCSNQETTILGAIPFQKNHVVVHTDTAVMHPNKLSWASWNTQVPIGKDTDSSQASDATYLGNPLQGLSLETAAYKHKEADSRKVCTATYWMNSLQGLSIKTPVFTSLNSDHAIDSKHILTKRVYQHPVFTPQSVAAQKLKHKIDGHRATYFVGAYWGWGFHEDGARSAVSVSELIRRQIL